MKATLHMLACCTLLTTTTTSAQQFVNGGFEPKATIAACTDVPIATYNANMGGNRAIGTATTMQIANNTCSQGSAVQGMYFGVMKYAPGSSAITSFKLDKNMTPGTKYSFAINYKAASGQAAGVMCSLRYGYGSDSTKADSFVAVSDPIEQTVWVKDTLSITPKIASQYVWVEVAVLGGDPFTVHIDGLTMLGLPSTGIEKTIAKRHIDIAPNPCSYEATVVLDANTSLPCRIQVYDVTGKIVLQKELTTERKMVISKDGLGGGIFFLRATDAKQLIYNAQFVIE